MPVGSHVQGTPVLIHTRKSEVSNHAIPVATNIFVMSRNLETYKRSTTGVSRISNTTIVQVRSCLGAPIDSRVNVAACSSP